MPNHRCSYCQQMFTPSRYRPDQVVCSGPACQRQRRAAYHRKKLQEDPLYPAQCQDSQKQWRAEHPNYMRTYRRLHARPVSKTRPHTKTSPDVVRLLERVKNNVAIDLKACPARVFLISPDERVKNILATAELILIEGLPKK